MSYNEWKKQIDKGSNYYLNYHKHTCLSNLKTQDSATMRWQYIDRMRELGHDYYFTTEHGSLGFPHAALYELDKYNLENKTHLKMGVASEMYYVKDRHLKDALNLHICLVAKNDNGVKALNKAISQANIDGIYYRPRIDDEIIFNLPPNDIIITTACVGGLLNNKNLNKMDLVIKLHEYFGDNFYIEIQSHMDLIQKELNTLALRLHNQYGIKLVHGNDSHYIYPEDTKYRDIYLKGKDAYYDYGGTFILDYPDVKTILQRYKNQNVLDEETVLKSLYNTLEFTPEEYTVYDKEIKIPQVYKDPLKKIKDKVNDSWKKEKNNIPKNRWKEYKDALREEMEVIEKTHMEQYFALNLDVIQLGIEKGGKLTLSCRGSAGSFLINKFFGFSDLDRLNLPITLYPSRFMSVDRILGSKSICDIDFNVIDQQPFIEASEEILGKENVGWLMALKNLQKPRAFRVYCKGTGMNITEYDEVAKDLDSYTKDPFWGRIIKESSRFVGVTEAVSPAPCSMLLWKDVAETVGYLNIKGVLCANLDSSTCDKYKFLKNDLLKVKVWEIIYDVFEMEGLECPSLKELEDLLDDKTFEIYENELTCLINQVDSNYATGLISKYKPKSLKEMTAFVAALRPSFKSLLDNFINRRGYTTHVKELDRLLEDSYHYLLYQESIMKTLQWLDIPVTGTYDIIKKISKKKFKEKELEELKKQLFASWQKKGIDEYKFNDVWQVMMDASKYAFNASHACAYAYDSLYGAYLKAHYPLSFYTVCLNMYYKDKPRAKRLIEELSYFDGKVEGIKFGESKRKFYRNKETRTIYKGYNMIKKFGVDSEIMDKEVPQLDTFFDVLEYLFINDLGAKKILSLIKINAFKDYGKIEDLLAQHTLYFKLYKKTKGKLDSIKTIKKTCTDYPMTIVEKHAEKETDKQFSKIDIKGLFLDMAEIIEPARYTEIQGAVWDLYYTEETERRTEEEYIIVTSSKMLYGKLYIDQAYNTSTGKFEDYQLDKKCVKANPLSTKDIHVIKINKLDIVARKRKKIIDGKTRYIVVEGEFNNVIRSFDVIGTYHDGDLV